jgi:hypothetical protein
LPCSAMSGVYVGRARRGHRQDGTKDTSQVTPGRTAPRPPGFSSPSSITSTCRSEATTLAVAARRTGRRYAWVLPDASGNALHPPAIVVVGNADEVMARLEHVDLFVVNVRRRDVAAVLRAAQPEPRGMVVVWHGDGWRHGSTRWPRPWALGRVCALCLPAHRQGRRGSPRPRRKGVESAD